MYTRSDEIFMYGPLDLVDILDPQGTVICRVPIDEAEALLSHLNR